MNNHIFLNMLLSDLPYLQFCMSTANRGGPLLLVYMATMKPKIDFCVP